MMSMVIVIILIITWHICKIHKQASSTTMSSAPTADDELATRILFGVIFTNENFLLWKLWHACMTFVIRVANFHITSPKLLYKKSFFCFCLFVQHTTKKKHFLLEQKNSSFKATWCLVELDSVSRLLACIDQYVFFYRGISLAQSLCAK